MSAQIYQFGASRAETAAYQVLKKAAVLKRIDGYCNGANCWMMLFDLTAAPAANAVPKKSLQVFGNDGFSYVFGEEVNFANGIYIGISSSEVNYVADSTDKVSGDLLVEDLDVVSGNAALQTAGDLTTGVDSKQVWADTASPGSKRLNRLDVINGQQTATMYLQIFAVDSPANGDVPVRVIPLKDVATVQQLDFGTDGVIPRSQTSAEVNHYGCTVWFSTTAGTLTKSTNTANKVLATYLA